MRGWFRGFGRDRLWLLANMFKGWGISMIDPGVQEYSMTDGRDVASTGIN